MRPSSRRFAPISKIGLEFGARQAMTPGFIRYSVPQSESRLGTFVLATPRTSPESGMQPSIDRLDQLRDLEPGWDAYGAAPIAAAAVEGAKDLLRSLSTTYPRLARSLRPYAVAPIATGGVHLEWRGGAKRLDVEVQPDGSIECVTVERVKGRRQYSQVTDSSAPYVTEVIAKVATSKYEA